MSYETLLVDKADRIAAITLNRPPMNPISSQLIEELHGALDGIESDNETRAIILAGAGEKAFCTGGDVKEYANEYLKRPHDYWKYMGLFSRYIESILNCGKVTVARLNGMAVGGGNESHLACDLSVMASHAYIAQVGSKVGSIACGGATQWRSLVILAPRSVRDSWTMSCNLGRILAPVIGLSSQR